MGILRRRARGRRGGPQPPSPRAVLMTLLLTAQEDLRFAFGSGQVTPPAYSDKEPIRRMYTAERKKFVEERDDLPQMLERRELESFLCSNWVSEVDPISWTGLGRN